jgi:hypothetical protein
MKFIKIWRYENLGEEGLCSDCVIIISCRNMDNKIEEASVPDNEISDVSNESEDVSLKSIPSKRSVENVGNGKEANSKNSCKRGPYKRKVKITDPEELAAGIIERSRSMKLVVGCDIFRRLGVFLRYKEERQNLGAGTHLCFVKKEDIIEHIKLMKLGTPEFFLTIQSVCCGCKSENADMYCSSCLEFGVKTLWCGNPECAVKHAAVNCADDFFLDFLLNLEV